MNMSELSDYKRIISEPEKKRLEATIQSQAARIEALEEALKNAKGVLMTRNRQIEELRDRLALLDGDY